MNWRQIPSFERLPLAQIIDRNPPGQIARMAVAMVAAAVRAGWSGVDPATRTELLREAIRPFDIYAHQRTENLQ